MTEVARRIVSGLLLAWAVFGGAPGCGGGSPDDDPISIGLLLSYTGPLASSATNSERALAMAIEAANQSGGVNGRRVKVIARDTRSDVRKLNAPVHELLAGGSAILIGPDYGDFLVHLRPILKDRTVLLPALTTASDGWDKPASWFVMGPSIPRVACELMAQVKADGRRNAIQIVSPGSYNGTLSYDLSNRYSLPKHVWSKDQASSSTVGLLTRALVNADAYLLLAPPEAAASLVYALTTIGALEDPERWYLSPTLHTPALLEAVPRGTLRGARGVSPGTVAGAAGFRLSFTARWHESPLDNAFAFYDAGAIAVLAIQRALQEGPDIPTGTALARQLLAITRAGGIPIGWNEIGRGLELLRQGQQIQYFGLTGQLEFDEVGKSQIVTTKWWSIGDQDFIDIPHSGGCE